jgi:predicted metal-binding membrane protein
MTESSVWRAPRQMSGMGLPSIRLFFWAHPEWWTLGVCAFAWILLGSQQDGYISTPVFCLGGGSTWTGLRWGSLGIVAAGLSSHMACWLLMVLAMMLPLAIGPIRHCALKSLWRRRHRAIMAFVFGFGALWTLAGVADFVLMRGLAISGSAKLWAGSAIFVVAAVWQTTIFKRLALSGCNLTIPLRPRGWRADFDCVSFGIIHGRKCFANCWIMMLALSFLPNQFVPMAAVTGICVVERYRPRRDQRREAVGLACIGFGCALAAFWAYIRAG